MNVRVMRFSFNVLVVCNMLSSRIGFMLDVFVLMAYELQFSIYATMLSFLGISRYFHIIMVVLWENISQTMLLSLYICPD